MIESSSLSNQSRHGRSCKPQFHHQLRAATPVAPGVLRLVLELDGEASAFTGRQPPHGLFGFCGASTSRTIKVQSDGAQLVVTAER
jgi:hypothetical protein